MTGRPALGCDAVVTTNACPAQAGVIDPGARKGQRTLVATLARGIRDDVYCRLAGSDRAAMTSGAIRDEPGVAHAGSSERYRALVASLTGRSGDDVVRGLAGRRDAVVAGRPAAAPTPGARFFRGPERT